MKIKKIIIGITSLVAIGGASAFASHTVTATADEENAYQLVQEAKDELTQEFNKQIEEIKTTNEEKDAKIQELQKQLDEANKKLQEQSVKEQSVQERTTEKNTEDEDSDYATHEYVDTTVDSAKQVTKEESVKQAKQEIEEENKRKEDEKEAERQRIAVEMEKERNESFPTPNSSN